MHCIVIYKGIISTITINIVNILVNKINDSGCKPALGWIMNNIRAFLQLSRAERYFANKNFSVWVNSKFYWKTNIHLGMDYLRHDNAIKWRFKKSKKKTTLD